MIYYEDEQIIIPKGISYNSVDNYPFSDLNEIKTALESKGVTVIEPLTISDIANYILTINGSNTEQNG